jgi:hypothetical protein
MLPLWVMREEGRRRLTIERIERMMIRIGGRRMRSLLVKQLALVGRDLHRLMVLLLLMMLLLLVLLRKVPLAAAGVRRRRRRHRAGEIIHPAAATASTSHRDGIIIRHWNGRGGRRGRRGDRAAATHAAGRERIQRQLTEWIEVHGYVYDQ